jgi:hypothetical protein
MKQSAEENIWISEEESNKRLKKKITYSEASQFVFLTVIMVIKLRAMRWARRVARIGEVYTEF